MNSADTQRLREVVCRCEAARAKTLDLLRGLARDQAEFSPGGKHWSLAQIADHLLLTEGLYRKQLRDLIAAARNGRRVTLQLNAREFNPALAFMPREAIALFSLPMRIFNRFVPHAVREMLIRFPVLPALSPTLAEPHGQRGIEELRRDLESSLSETCELLKGELPRDLLASAAEHPLLGRNNAIQLLELMAAHEQRHHGQMRRVFAAPDFPITRSALA